MRLIAPVVAFALLVTACGGDEADGDEKAETIAGPAVAPTLSPGDVSSGQVTIDDTAIDYVAVTPDGFEPGDVAPVLLAMPPGGQTLDLARSVVSGTYATEALTRGWVVVSPAAPDGQLYFQGSEHLIPGFLSWMETWVTPEGGQPHLAGISNGGLSSFRLAARQPDAFRSIVVFPGFPRSDEDRATLPALSDIPIRLYVGETDTGWVGPMEETFDTLVELGADVTIEIVPDEGHIIRSLSDGVIIFDQLDAAR